MGGCFSVDTPHIDGARVAKIVARRGAQIVKETREKFEHYKHEMKLLAPNAFVVPKDETGGHEVSLTEGKDDDKKVRTVALTSVTGDKLKEDVRQEVWNEMEPDVASPLSDKPEMVRKAALAGARKASDKASDAALDQLIKKLLKKIEEGQDVSDPETEGEAEAAPADEKKENAETEKKEQQENAL